MQALYESERAFLKLVFQNVNEIDANYLSEIFYPELLRLLLWRQKDLGANQAAIVKNIKEWQKLMPFDQNETMKSIYEESGLENQADLFEMHLIAIPGQVTQVE